MALGTGGDHRVHRHRLKRELLPAGLDARQAWYSLDLLRNDPFLEQRPLLFSSFGLTPGSAGVLQKMGSVRFVDEELLSRLGMVTEPPKGCGPDPYILRRRR